MVPSKSVADVRDLNLLAKEERGDQSLQERERDVQNLPTKRGGRGDQSHRAKEERGGPSPIKVEQSILI